MTQAPQRTDPFAPRETDTTRYEAPITSPPATGPATGPAPVVVRSRGGGGMLLNVLLGLALVVAVGGVAFAVGRSTAPAAAASNAGRFGANGGFAGQGGPTASGAPGAFGAGLGGGGVSVQGTVTAISADSITLQLTSGQTITIPTDAQTTWHQRAAATAADVTSGSTVVVQLQGGRGAFGNGNGNGQGQGNGPAASGAPGRAIGPATTVTLVPADS
jgi:hypothetical protein